MTNSAALHFLDFPLPGLPREKNRIPLIADSHRAHQDSSDAFVMHFKEVYSMNWTLENKFIAVASLLACLIVLACGLGTGSVLALESTAIASDRHLSFNCLRHE